MSFLNKVIDKLPIELHAPGGYQFCGPGTKLSKRIKRGDQGINPLDRVCRNHDIAYSQSSSLKDRRHADQILANEAWERVKSKNSSLGEKITAWAVTNAMKVKTKLGMGMRARRKSMKRKKSRKIKKIMKKKTFKQLVSSIGRAVKLTSPLTGSKAVAIALKVAKKYKSKAMKVPKVIPMERSGGILPLLPIFAGLSALGALSGGAAQIAKAVNTAQNARKELDEANRHNKTMEAIAIGKGLYLAPYKKGAGLYVRPYNRGKGLYVRPYNKGKGLYVRPYKKGGGRKRKRKRRSKN